MDRADPHPAPPAGRALRRRVLVVDDNADAAESLAMMLDLAGHDAKVAGGAREALALAGRWQPDVAVVDIGMPEMNGYDLCRLMRGTPWGERVRMIACTGWGMDDDRQRARAAGFDHHVVKPVDLRTLCQLIAGETPS